MAAVLRPGRWSLWMTPGDDEVFQETIRNKRKFRDDDSPMTPSRVATVREKVSEKKFFKIMEKSGNFVTSQ